MSMIEVNVNGEKMEIEEQSSISDLIEKLGAQSTRIAVEQNLEIIPKTDYDKTLINAGDTIEVVAFVGGG